MGERVWRHKPKPRGSSKIEHCAPAQELETRKRHLSVPGKVRSYKHHQQKHRKTTLCGQEDSTRPVTMTARQNTMALRHILFVCFCIYHLCICLFASLLVFPRDRHASQRSLLYEIRTHKYRAKGRGSIGRGRHSALSLQVETKERNTQVNKQPTTSNTVSPERSCPVNWAALLSPTPGSGSASWLG